MLRLVDFLFFFIFFIYFFYVFSIVAEVTWWDQIDRDCRASGDDLEWSLLHPFRRCSRRPLEDTCTQRECYSSPAAAERPSSTGPAGSRSTGTDPCTKVVVPGRLGAEVGSHEGALVEPL